MANDMARMEGQQSGRKSGKSPGKSRNRESTNVTATMHAEHGKKASRGKKK